MGRYRNLTLPPPPTREEVARALLALEREDFHRPFRISADRVAWKLGVEPARRLGNGAVKGSWSGYMSPALRVVPILRAMAKDGLVDVLYDPASHRTRNVYRLTAAGRALAEP